MNIQGRLVFVSKYLTKIVTNGVEGPEHKKSGWIMWRAHVEPHCPWCRLPVEKTATAHTCKYGPTKGIEFEVSKQRG